jgi:hypothetical protein
MAYGVGAALRRERRLNDDSKASTLGRGFSKRILGLPGKTVARQFEQTGSALVILWRARLFLKDLFPDIAEDRELAARQVGQACLRAEVCDLALLTAARRAGSLASSTKPRLAPDRVIISGSGNIAVGVQGVQKRN